MSANPKDETAVHEGERNYQFLCLAALLLVFVALAARGISLYWSLVTIMIGLIGVWLRWRFVPVLQILALVVLLTITRDFRPRLGSRPYERTLSDLLLCVAVLGFVIGHMRLYGLTVAIFPRDWRRREPASPGTKNRRQRFSPPRGPVRARRRGGQFATVQELGVLLVSLPLWAGLAQTAYVQLVPDDRSSGLLDRNWEVEDEPAVRALGPAGQRLFDSIWTARYLIWGLGGGVLLVSVLLRHLALRSMTPAEATLLLQDALWAETRREQRRINRWSAWARLWQSRKEDRP